MLKLNLGCGSDLREGYVNVDARKLHASIVQADLSIFPWPFENNCADEILMLDFLEHFPYASTNKILLEAHRVLCENGKLIIQVPDADQLANAITQSGFYLCNDHPTIVKDGACCECGKDADTISDIAMKRLFGGQDYQGNFHFTCFTRRMLQKKCLSSGFIFEKDLEIEHQTHNWNFKLLFKKGDVW